VHNGRAFVVTISNRDSIDEKSSKVKSDTTARKVFER
jgi:hypothetical protein